MSHSGHHWLREPRRLGIIDGSRRPWLARQGEVKMPFVSIVTGWCNEEENVPLLYEQVKEVFANLPGYCYERIFIDNASTDGTVKSLKKIAAADKCVKVIVNARNFGHIRSPHYALLES